MERRPVTFFSEGLRLDGELHLPAGLEPGERRPAIITCSGYQGLKAIHPERFARALTPDGYVCLADEALWRDFQKALDVESAPRPAWWKRLLVR